MSRAHIRDAEWRLTEAKRVFYRGNSKAVRENLLKAIRHITKALLKQ
jgi:hypothetical protein